MHPLFLDPRPGRISCVYLSLRKVSRGVSWGLHKARGKFGKERNFTTKMIRSWWCYHCCNNFGQVRASSLKYIGNEAHDVVSKPKQGMPGRSICPRSIHTSEELSRVIRSPSQTGGSHEWSQWAHSSSCFAYLDLLLSKNHFVFSFPAFGMRGKGWEKWYTVFL